MKEINSGLNNEQVQERVDKGLINGISKPVSKTYYQIFIDNICTLFNLLNFIIFIALIWVKAWSNIIFMAIIVCNAVIGIIQEIKAKRLVDKLSILTKPTVTVIRNNKSEIIDISEIVIDDILVLESGNQVCNDAIVISGAIDTNESLLTGEVDPIHKGEDSKLLSGSSVVSGKCFARVINVGADNYATTLIKEAQKVKENNSELMESMKKVTRFTTFMIIPLGVLLFIEALYLRQDSLFRAVVFSTAGLLGMLPKGLVLLTSVSLANGVTRLAKKNILIQDLYSLETLSHVDVLCLDKTGTITDGKMKVEEVIELDSLNNHKTHDIIGSYLNICDDNNATFQAISTYFNENSLYECVNKIPFSSIRKWSAVEFKEIGTIVIGAVEKIILNELPDRIKSLMDQGLRIVAVGHTFKTIDENSLPELKTLMIIVLSDTIRNQTKETLEYFHHEGIDIKVISGDNVNTVSAIAKKAGVLNYQHCIDMSMVEDTEIEDIICSYTVFGRVTPNQKKLIVEALKKKGRHVAMTGDGVNDLLALKESDCSIAIAQGSDASKQISQVVLLNSDFACLPDILLEGRKVVNNVTRVAGVFFIKTIYTVLLSLFCVFSNREFPFIPLQITLIDLLIEAMPSFMTIFESNTSKVKGKFLSKALSKAFSNALSIVIIFILIMLISPILKLDNFVSITIMYIVLGVVSIIAVIRSCFPFTRLRIFICIAMIAGFGGAILFFFEPLHLAKISFNLLLISFACILIALLLERKIHFITQKTNIFNKIDLLK